jgi:cytidyltransferase-like protein
MSDKIVLCHGCFDLMHIGHIKHLKKAKEFGDILVVGITSDRWINKGDSINKENVITFLNKFNL